MLALLSHLSLLLQRSHPKAVVRKRRKNLFCFLCLPPLSSKLGGDAEPPDVSWSDYQIVSASNRRTQREHILQLVQPDSQVHSAHGLREPGAQAQRRAARARCELLAAVRLDDLLPAGARAQPAGDRAGSEDLRRQALASGD